MIYILSESFDDLLIQGFICHQSDATQDATSDGKAWYATGSTSVSKRLAPQENDLGHVGQNSPDKKTSRVVVSNVSMIHWWDLQ
jgi:hypothetical protein